MIELAQHFVAHNGGFMSLSPIYCKQLPQPEEVFTKKIKQVNPEQQIAEAVGRILMNPQGIRFTADLAKKDEKIYFPLALKTPVIKVLISRGYMVIQKEEKGEILVHLEAPTAVATKTAIKEKEEELKKNKVEKEENDCLIS